MKKTKGLINHIKSDKVYEPISTEFTVNLFTKWVKELLAKKANQPDKAMHLMNGLGAFKVVDGFWYILLTDGSYIHCESPYDKDLKLKDKVIIVE